MPKPMFDSAPENDDLFPEDAPAATPAATREEFIRRARSGYTKIRNSFVQTAPTRAQGGSRPAVLGAFARNHRAAVLYLALLTNWTWLSRGEESLPASTWIRFLSCDDSRALTWTPQSLSHAWGVLEDLQLVTRVHTQRRVRATPLNEGGSGSAYTRPEGTAGDVYFVLPHEFWLEQMHGTLSWPALAVLLILLKETGGRPYAELVIDRAERYYGISRTTAEKGLTELRKRGLLESTTRWVRDVDSSEGRRHASLHALLGPFALPSRQALQTAANLRQSAGAKPAGKKSSTKKSAENPTSKKSKKTRKPEGVRAKNESVKDSN